MRRIVLLCSLLALILVPVVAQDNSITATIDDTHPFYQIPVNIPEGGQTLTADIAVAEGDLDTVLYLVDADGNIIAENDDRARGDTTSLLVVPTLDAGDYRVIATRYKMADGDTSGEFALKITLNPDASGQKGYDVTDLGAADFPVDDPPRPEAEWTVLAYYGADTNLEPGLLNDFNEFETAGGSDDRVRVIVMMDRHPGFSDASGDWTDTRLFEAGTTLGSVKLAELGELDMGDGETLARFLTWGIQHYPARNYAVAFGSHGAAWQGLISDETDGDNILSLAELQAAFDTTIAATGIEQFDLLINDACSMSSVEYHLATAPYFRVSYASPEIIVDPALDMGLFTELLREGQSDPTAIGERLIDKYLDQDVAASQRSDADYLSNAVTDLTDFAPVAGAIRGFVAVFNEDPQRYGEMLGKARSNTYTYSAFLGEKSLVDLGDLMAQIKSIAGDEDLDLTEAADGVIQALETASLFGRAGPRAESGSSYYNIFFPERSRDFDVDYQTQTTLPEWGRMLRTYFNTSTPSPWNDLDPETVLNAGLGELVAAPKSPGDIPFHGPIAPTVRLYDVYPEIASINTQINIYMEVMGRDIGYGVVTVDRIADDGGKERLNVASIVTDVEVDGEVVQINQWEPGVEVSTFVWDVDLYSLSDGITESVEFINELDGLGAVEGRYRTQADPTWRDISVVFDEDGEVDTVVSRAGGSGALGVIRMAEDSVFQVYREIVTPDGNTTLVPGTLYQWPVSLNLIPAPSGEYEVGVKVQTYGGLTGFDSVRVTVDNEGVDLGIMGLTDVDWGFTYQYDSTVLSPPAFYTSDQSYFSADESGELFTEVWLVDTEATDPLDIAETFVFDYEYDIFISDGRDISVDGLLAYEFTYFYDDDIFGGQGLAVYQTLTETPLVFLVDGFEDDPLFYETYERLIDSLDFFRLEDTRNWTIDYLDDGLISYPVLADWMPGNETEFGYRYSPGNDLASTTFAEVLFTEAEPGDSQADLVDAFISEILLSDVTAYAAYDEVLFSEAPNHDWLVGQYTAERDGLPVIGRVYGTVVADWGTVMWFETPLNAAAPETFARIFELMVEGFLFE